MWFAIIVFVVLFIFYFFNNAFQQGVNNLLAAAGHWLARNLHIPTWIIMIGRWLWQRFRSGLLFIMALIVVLSGVWMYAYKTGNPQVLLVAMAITGILMFIIAILSQVIQGFGAWFGLETKTGGFGKMAISIIFWIMVNFAILSIPDNWYFNHLWVLVVVTALLLAFMLKGWYYNETPKYTPETFIIIFIGFLLFSGYMNWEAGKIHLPGWLQNKANEIRLEKEVDGQMLLASFVQSSVAYRYDKVTGKYEPAPKIKYHPGSTVLVSKPNTSPDASQGESMLEVMRQNEYGDFFGTGVWVPARKLEYLSPSSLREIKKRQLANQPDTVAVLSGTAGEVWFPPEPNKIYKVVIPPETRIEFETDTGWTATYNNLSNLRPLVRQWRPRAYEVKIKKVKGKGGPLIILKNF
jgi:hypothetical protein